MHKALPPLLALTLAACATQLGVRNNSDQRLSMFSQVVFAPDYDSRRSDFIAKWETPLSIHLKDRDTVFVEKYKGVVKQRTKSLSNLTGLGMDIVTESKPANVTIYFDTQTAIQAIARSKARNSKAADAGLAAAGCYSEIDKDAAHRITGARIFVHAEKDLVRMLSTPNTVATTANEATRLRVHRCLRMEIIRILGFRNTSDVFTPSIFNANATLAQPTVLDLKMIRTLYEPALKPGMPRRDALRAAEPLLQK